MTIDAKELPRGWATSKLDEITTAVSTNGKKVKTKDAHSTGEFPVIDQGATECAGYLDDESLVIHASLDHPIVLFGDHTRIVKYIQRDFIPGADGTKLLQAKSGIQPKYLHYLVTAAEVPDRGYGRHFHHLKEIELPVAPAAEQKRIADKLDTVLSRVDAVSARLARVAPLLKRFRQSVLAAATSGRLTEDWRGNRKATYPKLPMAEIADMRLGKMLDKAKNTGAAVRYLRNVNVRWFSFDLSDVLELRIEEHERDGLSIMDGDLLVCEGGEPGRCAVWQGGPTDLIFQKALHRVRPDASVALSTWIAYVLKHLCDSGEITSFLTGSTIKHLTGRALAKVPVPIPSLDEQAEIVRRVDILFAFANRLEGRLQTAQTATERLTPALLAKAFRGELVPQDPDDEPASELLRRLQAASDHLAPARAAGRGRKRSI